MQLGLRGATQQSWQRQISIRVHIKEIQDEHPRAGEKRLVQLLADRMREEEDVLLAAAEYAVKNAVIVQHSYARRQSDSTYNPPTKEERAQEEAAITAAAKQAAAQILLLNQEMPNGKRMRYCTGAEMEKFGKGYARIAKKVGKTKLVGVVLDESGVRHLMG